MIDLHLHSAYSDGDLPVAALIEAVAARGVRGVSLTDHNGVWGSAEAREACAVRGLTFIEGIEISAAFAGLDIHILGYRRTFDAVRLHKALAATRVGYEARAREMIARGQAAGFPRLSFADVQQRRSGQHEPLYLSYDVARELVDKYGLRAAEARKLTTTGGACHVPYGDWALTPAQAVAALHEAGALASLAHPGLIAVDGGDMEGAIREMAAAGLDGLEVYHPYHDEAMIARLRQLAEHDDLLVTGGSDWHGPGRYPVSDRVFGRIGISGDDEEKFLTAIAAL